MVELRPEHGAAGASVVIEAKEDASYTLSEALREIDEARKNRDAVGLFVRRPGVYVRGRRSS